MASDDEHIAPTSWQAAIDRRLARRLLRPLVQPGLVRPGFARALLARMDRMSEPPALAAAIIRRWSDAENAAVDRQPIVYAEPAADRRDRQTEAPAGVAGSPLGATTPPVIAVGRAVLLSAAAPAAPVEVAPRVMDGAEAIQPRVVARLAADEEEPVERAPVVAPAVMRQPVGESQAERPLYRKPVATGAPVVPTVAAHGDGLARQALPDHFAPPSQPSVLDTPSMQAEPGPAQAPVLAPVRASEPAPAVQALAWERPIPIIRSTPSVARAAAPANPEELPVSATGTPPLVAAVPPPRPLELEPERVMPALRRAANPAPLLPGNRMGPARGGSETRLALVQREIVDDAARPIMLPASPAPAGVAPEPPSTLNSAPSAPLPAAAVPPAAADMEELVDRTVRKLLRQLAVEGERRGWTRWP